MIILSIQILLALLVALAIDHFLGELPVRFHPVVWMGNYLAWAGEQVQSLSRQTLASGDAAIESELADLPAFVLGALAWLSGMVQVGAVAHGALPNGLGWHNGQANVLGVYRHGLFEDATAVQALFGAGRAQPVPTLDSVFEGLADYVQTHFEPGVLDALIR